MKRTFSHKKIFGTLFIILSVILIMLPFATTFNEFLTRIVENLAFYKILQSYAVPYMAQILYKILVFMPGLKVLPIPQGVVVNGTDVIVNWNCLGWQSYLLFFISLLVGLRGNFTKKSIVIAIVFGISGTFLINIFRMVFTAALVGWWKGLFVILFHNYFMTFVTIIWLFFFWWFVYGFVLEGKEENFINRSPDKR